MLKTYDYRCEGCLAVDTKLVEVDQRDELQECTCGAFMKRTWTAPNIRTEKTSASYIDGQRGGSKAFRDLRRQNALEDVITDNPSLEVRAEAEKELSVLTKKK
jgi:predicted nucleic acid-binding Zn ribbon protein